MDNSSKSNNQTSDAKFLGSILQGIGFEKLLSRNIDIEDIAHAYIKRLDCGFYNDATILLFEIPLGSKGSDFYAEISAAKHGNSGYKDKLYSGLFYSSTGQDPGFIPQLLLNLGLAEKIGATDQTG